MYSNDLLGKVEASKCSMELESGIGGRNPDSKMRARGTKCSDKDMRIRKSRLIGRFFKGR